MPQGGGAVGQPYRPLAAAAKGQGVVPLVLTLVRASGQRDDRRRHGDGDPTGSDVRGSVSLTLADVGVLRVLARDFHDGESELSERVPRRDVGGGVASTERCGGSAGDDIGQFLRHRRGVVCSKWFSQNGQAALVVLGGHWQLPARDLDLSRAFCLIKKQQSGFDYDVLLVWSMRNEMTHGTHKQQEQSHMNHNRAARCGVCVCERATAWRQEVVCASKKPLLCVILSWGLAGDSCLFL